MRMETVTRQRRQGRNPVQRGARGDMLSAMRGNEDERLVERVVGGDDGAFSELYARYSSLVYGTGIRYLGDRGAAEDLVQDVFVAVWRNAGRFDPSKASFATWLYRITRNRAMDLIRRRRVRSRKLFETFEEASEEDHSTAVLRGFELFEALARLSPEHREVVMLSYFEGLSQREISERTDLPLGTVKSRATAALRALRSAIPAEDADA